MQYLKVAVPTAHGMHAINHLLFVDDLKLFAEGDEELKAMAKEIQRFFTVAGLEVNRENAVTNLAACTNTAVLLEGARGYNYLGIMKDSTSKPTRESYNRIRTEMLARVEQLCKTSLNGKKLLKQ
ncbi:hypothetical protein PAEPH01_1204 [Pancytospora epiphaga]|nr:hypothetical protein PAEPH01_1204 [Pancytospora epiphaga]